MEIPSYSPDEFITCHACGRPVHINEDCMCPQMLGDMEPETKKGDDA